ncbi:MAG: menaquinone biosynthesis protein [Isosphaeraceae bacterium]|nr:menaquinone biosynthesis protein [Isosphaeraceae bacterium]
MSSHSGLRVGAVSYLNAKPLYHRLEEFAPGIELTMDYPSRLADRLAAGDLDVALIPSVEYLRGSVQGYEIIPGFAIAARGPVRSVKLFCRTSPDRIHRLALDEGSRTSQALTRVMLAERYGVRPADVEPLPMGVPVQESTADAVLLIGDRAMLVPDDGFHSVIDLAEAWNAWTGLPFVFALWATRAGVDLGDFAEHLTSSRESGLRHARAIAEEHGPRLGLSVEHCVDYLTNVLSYDLGVSELAGLHRFADSAAALSLVPEGARLVFHRRRDLATRR